jgi:hypothetical protein
MQHRSDSVLDLIATLGLASKVSSRRVAVSSRLSSWSRIAVSSLGIQQMNCPERSSTRLTPAEQIKTRKKGNGVRA